ncbi:MAG: toll/interleukin-1 receptor domain-containing protein [Chloroflexota bacterium]
MNALLEGIQAIQKSDLLEGKRLLLLALESESLTAQERVIGFIWLAETDTNPQFKIDQYQQAIRLDPDNQDVLRRLQYWRQQLSINKPPQVAPPANQRLNSNRGQQNQQLNQQQSFHTPSQGMPPVDPNRGFNFNHQRQNQTFNQQSFQQGIPSSNVPQQPYNHPSPYQQTPSQHDGVLFRTFFQTQSLINEVTDLFVYAYIPEFETIVFGDARQHFPSSVSVQSTQHHAKAHIKHGTPITISFQSEGVIFHPIDSATKLWNGSWLRYGFRYQMPGYLANRQFSVRIRVSIFGIEISSQTILLQAVTYKPSQGHPYQSPASQYNPLHVAKVEQQSHTVSRTYEKIFVSYSRQDRDVVEAYRFAQLALGNDVFIDRYSIKPGENWRYALANAIDNADIFQLFWSHHSARSSHVRDEWLYALHYRCREDACENFIRPIYWVDPMPEDLIPPQELQHLNFRYVSISAIDASYYNFENAFSEPAYDNENQLSDLATRVDALLEELTLIRDYLRRNQSFR